MVKDFFKESKEQSRIKSEIVSKYLWAWAHIMIPSAKKANSKIGYIDLFAGPGRYEDGTKSTPILILEKAIADPNMRNMLVTVFNDADPNNTLPLQESIKTIPKISILKYQPQINTEVIQEKIAEIFESMKMIPCLTFLDPWGYKGLSNKLINSVVKDWGCECIIFFNYNRINMGLGNKLVEEHMNALFGKQRAEKLRNDLTLLTPDEREATILSGLSETLKEMGARYLLPFRFRGEQGNRISHHLILVTKHPKGYEVMKDIMAKVSSSEYRGVPSFEYSPLKKTYQLSMYLGDQTIDKLKTILLDYFQGRKLSVGEIYRQHNTRTLFIKTNYKTALLELEDQGIINTIPPKDKRRKIRGESTLGDNVIIIFPN